MNIQTGEKLFEFRSKQDWINKASRIWRFHQVRSENTICVDQQGRICNIGAHFMTAERDNAYPAVATSIVARKCWFQSMRLSICPQNSTRSSKATTTGM